jgi:DNA-binding response OmpR family regulator
MTERKPRILIIEDDEYSGEAYTHLLAAEGYEAQWTGDGAEGYSMAREMHPDAVILDLSLPGLDGMRVIDLFRRDESLKQTPILVITGRDDEEARAAIDAGANSYLTKPVEFNDLTSALASLGASKPEQQSS